MENQNKQEIKEVQKVQEENQNQTDQEYQKYLLADVVATNCTIQNSIYLLMRADFEIVENLLDQTPPEMQDDESYLALLAAKEFYEKLKEIQANR